MDLLNKQPQNNIASLEDLPISNEGWLKFLEYHDEQSNVKL